MMLLLLATSRAQSVEGRLRRLEEERGVISGGQNGGRDAAADGHLLRHSVTACCSLCFFTLLLLIDFVTQEGGRHVVGSDDGGRWLHFHLPGLKEM